MLAERGADAAAMRLGATGTITTKTQYRIGLFMFNPAQTHSLRQRATHLTDIVTDKGREKYAKARSNHFWFGILYYANLNGRFAGNRCK